MTGGALARLRARVLGQQFRVLDGERFQLDRESFQFSSLLVREFALVAPCHQVIEALLGFRVNAMKLRRRRLPNDQVAEIDTQGFADGPNDGSADVQERLVTRQTIDRFQIETVAFLCERLVDIDHRERTRAHQFRES